MKDIELFNCFDKISKNYSYGNIKKRIYSEYRYYESSILNKEISSLEVDVAIGNSKKVLSFNMSDGFLSISSN